MRDAAKIILAILLTLSTVTMAAVIHIKFRQAPEYRLRDIKDKTVLFYDSKYNFRQSDLNCGSYAAAAIIRVLADNKINSEEVVDNMRYRLPNKYTTPLGIIQSLKKYGIKSDELFTEKLKPNECLSVLRERLSRDRPIILLGEIKEGEYAGFDHYVVLLGFSKEEDEFYIYDSLYAVAESELTKDNNGPLAGNITWTNQELLDFWQGGGMYGLYRWYAIAAYN